MGKLLEIINATEHISVQLGKAHSVLNEVCSHFESEDQYKDLPRMAQHINGLLAVIDDYILDAAGAAGSVTKKAQRLIEISPEISEIEEDADYPEADE